MFSGIQAVICQREELALMLSEAEAGQRAIADMVGVSNETISKDVNKMTHEKEIDIVYQGIKEDIVNKVTPSISSGEQLAEKQHKKDLSSSRQISVSLHAHARNVTRISLTTCQSLPKDITEKQKILSGLVLTDIIILLKHSNYMRRKPRKIFYKVTPKQQAEEGIGKSRETIREYRGVNSPPKEKLIMMTP